MAARWCCGVMCTTRTAKPRWQAVSAHRGEVPTPPVARLKRLAPAYAWPTVHPYAWEARVPPVGAGCSTRPISPSLQRVETSPAPHWPHRSAQATPSRCSAALAPAVPQAISTSMMLSVGTTLACSNSPQPAASRGPAPSPCRALQAPVSSWTKRGHPPIQAPSSGPTPPSPNKAQGR